MLKETTYLVRSRKRIELFKLLEKPKTPTQLSKFMKSSLPNVSLKLRDLSERGLVICINPEDRKGRIYQLTEKGNKVLEELKGME